MRSIALLGSLALGIVSLLLGTAQLVWPWWAAEASLHMGSPLRLHGRYLVRKTDDPLLKRLASEVYETGRIGFELLGDSLWLHFFAGIVAVLVGSVVIIVTWLLWTGRLRTVWMPPNNSFKPTAQSLRDRSAA